MFSGTQVPTTIPLVIGQGSPITTVISQGNTVQQTQQDPNGTTITNGVTLQQAFNYGAPDGSPDVFQTLITLRDTMNQSRVVDESGAPLNLHGTAITNATA